MIVLTQTLVKSIFPNASSAIINAFITKQSVMKDILQSQNRLAFCFANVHAETRGLTILTENINYSFEGMATTWKNRFQGDPAKVIAKYGDGPDWRRNAFNDIYGTRMGNRPNTNDGYSFIGRGGPQVTGRDGYTNISNIIGVNLIINPVMCAQPDLQPAIIAAFWQWKSMNRFADANNFTGCVEAWNGGDNGIAERRAQLARITKLIANYLAVPTAAVNIQPTATPIDEVLKSYQQKLIDLGYFNVGGADGRDGGATRGAITSFYTDRGIMGPANIDNALYAEIDKAIGENWHRPIVADRAYVTAKELAPTTPSIAHAQNAGVIAKVLAWFSGPAAVVQGAVSFMPTAHDTAYPYISIMQEFFTSIPGWVYAVIIFAIAIAIFRNTGKSTDAVVADKQTGRLN